MITVFFDGKCGLCRREIDHYRRIAPPDIFRWVDIVSDPQPLRDLGVRVEDGLRTLHVQDGDGAVRQGVDSFLVIWEHIPRFRILSHIVRVKPLYLVACFLYKRFAIWHFAHMGYRKCDI